MTRMKLGLGIGLFLLLTVPLLAHTGHSQGPHPNATAVDIQGDPMLPGILLVATVVGFLLLLVVLAYYVRRREITPELEQDGGSLTEYRDADAVEDAPEAEEDEDDADAEAA